MPIPLAGYQRFTTKIQNFPEEVYALRRSDRLSRLMWTMLQDPGLGQLKKMQALAWILEHLGATSFSDLDQFFGAWLQFSRLPDEQYIWDAFGDQLTAAQWNEIKLKDAAYRNRIAKFGQALLRGGTNEGIAMAAEAACGYPCQVVEAWRYTSSVGIGEIGRLNAAKEVVIIPLTDELTYSQERAIYHVIDRLKPANIFTTVDDQGGLAVQTVVSIRHVTSPSEYYEVQRYVAPQTLPNPIPRNTQVWIKENQEVEAPQFAYMNTQQTEWSLNESIPTMTATTDTHQFGKQIAITVNPMGGSTGQQQVNIYWLGGERMLGGQPPPLPFKVRIGGRTGETDPKAWTYTSEFEIVLVKGMHESHNGSESTWDIERAQDGTAAVVHPHETPIYISEVPLNPPPPPPPPDPGGGGAGWGPWREFELADSPDNYPSGKYSGDPSKYDTTGEYVFAWDSQGQFESWWTREILKLGGEVNGHLFRLPVADEPSLVTGSRVGDSLAAPEMTVTGTFFPTLRDDDL